MIALLIVLGVVVVLGEIVLYIAHLSMNPDKQGYLTPREFKEKFDAVEWTDTKGGFSFNGCLLYLINAKSLWNHGHGDELHASIVQFSNKKYGLYYHTYIYSIFYIRKYFRESRVKGKIEPSTKVSMLGDITRRVKLNTKIIKTKI